MRRGGPRRYPPLRAAKRANDYFDFYWIKVAKLGLAGKLMDR